MITLQRWCPKHSFTLLSHVTCAKNLQSAPQQTTKAARVCPQTESPGSSSLHHNHDGVPNAAAVLSSSKPDTKTGLSNPKLQNLVLENFPKSQLCFAYGSKILHQLENLPDSSTMTDLIFVVENTRAWHDENLKRNKHHYSRLIQAMGSDAIALIQNTKPYCFFNPFVEVDGVLLKYGVVEESYVLKDLQQWDTLYIAGRLHKPVLVLDMDPSFKTQFIKLNLRSALHSALLFLPDRFSDAQLFSVISRISYHGDIRMYLNVENPNKVRNIVEPNIPYFRELYESYIDDSPFIERTDYGYCQAAKTEKNLLRMEPFLPPKLLNLPEGNINPKSRVFLFDKNIDPKHQLFRKVAAGDTRYCEEQLRLIIMWPSVYQTVKGVLSAGVLKSWKYSSAKVKKSKVPGSAVTVKKKDDEGESGRGQVVKYSGEGREDQLMSSEYQNYSYKNSNSNPENRKAFLVTWCVMLSFLFYVIHTRDLWDKLP